MKKLNIIVASFFLISGLVLLINIKPTNATMMVLAQVTISNAKAVLHTKGVYSASFDLYNGGDTQTGIRYGVELVPIVNGEPDYTTVADQKIVSDSISISALQTITLNVDYSIPQNISGSYELLAVVSNKGGLMLATAHLTDISVATKLTNSINIDTSSCYLSISGDLSNKHFTLSEGVDVSSRDNLLLNCKATSLFNTPITVTPVILTSLRSVFGDAASSTNASILNSAISFDKNETKNISISIPKSIAPQAYTSIITLQDSSSNIISNSVSLHWVLQGDSATIQDVSTDKSEYLAGDTAVVSLLWSGRADSFNGSRIGASTTPISGVIAHVTLCGQTVDQALGLAGKINIQIPILSDCLNPNVFVTLGTATQRLDSVSGSIESYVPPQSSQSSPATASSGDYNGIVILILIVVVAIIIAFIALFLEKASIKSIAIILIIGGSALIALNSGVSVKAFVGTVQSVSYSDPKTDTTYQCNFTSSDLPHFTIGLYSYYQAGGVTIPVGVSNANTVNGSTCLATQRIKNPDFSTSSNRISLSHNVSNLSTQQPRYIYVTSTTTVSLVGDSVIVSTGSSSGQTIVSSSSFAGAPNTYNVPADFSGAVSVKLQYKIVTVDGTVLATPTATESTNIISWDITLNQGGTISWVDPAIVLDYGAGSTIASLPQFLRTATVSINKTVFNPGEDITFTATDPIVFFCTNLGASSFPTIDISYLPLSQQGANKIHATSFTKAVTNASILNSASSPLHPGDYFLFAAYSNELKDHSGDDWIIPDGTVRIPFTVKSLVAPIVSSSAPLCDATTGGAEVSMNWSSTNPGSSYYVYRSSDGGTTYKTVATLSNSTNSYTDKGDITVTNNSVTVQTRRGLTRTTLVPTSTITPLDALANYTYVISTGDNFGNSASSTPFNVTTLDCSSTTTVATTTTTVATSTGVTSTSTNTTSTTTTGGPSGNGNGTVQIGGCAPISHAELCPGSSTNVQSNTLDTVEASSSTCQSASLVSPLSCEFYCDSPYQPQNHQCVDTSTIEI